MAAKISMQRGTRLRIETAFYPEKNVENGWLKTIEAVPVSHGAREHWAESRTVSPVGAFHALTTNGPERKLKNSERNVNLYNMESEELGQAITLPERRLKEQGMTTEYRKSGLMASLKRQSPDHRYIYPYMDELLENTKFSHFKPVNQRHSHKNIYGQAVYYSAARIKGKLY